MVKTMVKTEKLLEKRRAKRIGHMKKVESRERRKRIGHMKRRKEEWHSESESK